MKRFVSLVLSVCFLFSINTVSYGKGCAIFKSGFHPVGVHVVAAGKRFLRVIKVEILISFHLNSSFNDFEI